MAKDREETQLTEEEQKEAVKKKEKTTVMITLTVFFLTVIIIVVRIYFPNELDIVLEYIKKGASLVFDKVITPVVSAIIAPIIKLIIVGLIMIVHPILNYFVTIKKDKDEMFDFVIRKDGDNNNMIAIALIIFAILGGLYFSGKLEAFFYRYERIVPGLTYNVYARSKKLITKYSNQIDVQNMTFKSIQHHPCWKSIKKRPLCDFWVCSSWKSYLPGWHKKDYASYEAITYCMKYGARYIELDIFNKNMCPYAEPVVCNGHTPGNYQYTTVLDFKKCCKLIRKNMDKFFVNNGVCDPLFLCLNLHLEGNWSTLNKIAHAIETIFAGKLMSKEPPYRDNLGRLRNLGTFKFEMFLDKVVIITNTFIGGIGSLANSRMGSVYDICYQSHKMDIKTKPGFKAASLLADPTSADKDWLHSYSYEFSNNIGSNISKTASALVRIYPNPVASCEWDYDIKDPKNKTNFWPETMFKIGSQFNLMDFASDDENFISYLNFFFGPGDGTTDAEMKRGIVYYDTDKCASLKKLKKNNKKEMKAKIQDEPEGCLKGKNAEAIDIRQTVEYRMDDDPDRCGYGKIYKGYPFALKPFSLQVPTKIQIDTS